MQINLKTLECLSCRERSLVWKMHIEGDLLFHEINYSQVGVLPGEQAPGYAIEHTSDSALVCTECGTRYGIDGKRGRRLADVLKCNGLSVDTERTDPLSGAWKSLLELCLGVIARLESTQSFAEAQRKAPMSLQSALCTFLQAGDGKIGGSPDACFNWQLYAVTFVSDFTKLYLEMETAGEMHRVSQATGGLAPTHATSALASRVADTSDPCDAESVH